MPNRLAEATSPYLLQHADNPVEWWEWSPEAFEEAARRDVPVLLSVGYASCHWCHVMAHESFEDPATAQVMNERFVNIKVDREERPDVDRIYMDAVQAMTGRGGWPMTVFMTPSGEPFHAGTYYPREDRHGHPSFVRVLDAVHKAWSTQRDEVVAQGHRLAAAVAAEVPAADQLPGRDVLESAYAALEAAFDPVHGGFGGAPKFPQAPTLEFLLRSAGHDWAAGAEGMLTATLQAMADGGIRDHVAGGFSRYSVDRQWLVPHFEKMLYDNALLARLYLRAGQVTGQGGFFEVARSTLDYILADLRLPERGFASGEDADSEGEEGRFYVFDWDEIESVAPSAAVAEVLGATPRGNFEGGRSIIHRSRSVDDVAAEYDLDPTALASDVAETLHALGELRATRVRPGLDDKAVAAWNGLAIHALAEAGSVLDEPRYAAAAVDTARFVLEHMRHDDGRLMRAWRHGRASGPAFCDDYGAVALGLLALHQATGDPSWFHEARALVDAMVDLFHDPDTGAFYATGHDAEQLIARPVNLFDNPTPSDNSLAAEALLHIGALTGEDRYWSMSDGSIRAAAALMERYPTGAGQMLAILATRLGGPVEVAIVGGPASRRPLERVVADAFRPGVFVATGPGDDDLGIPLLEQRPAQGDTAAAYVCRDFVCDAPVTSANGLRAALTSSPGAIAQG